MSQQSTAHAGKKLGGEMKIERPAVETFADRIEVAGCTGIPPWKSRRWLNLDRPFVWPPRSHMLTKRLYM
jgi:hypothetical protein